MDAGGSGAPRRLARGRWATPWVYLGAVQLVLSALLARALVAESPREVLSVRPAPGATGPERAGTARGTANGDTSLASTSGRSPRSGGRAASAARAVAPDVSRGEIKVGILVTQSGGLTFDGTAQAAKAYFAAVNRAGGVNGYRFIPVVDDDGLDPNRGMAITRRMILQDKVFSMVAWGAPQTELIVVPTLEEYGVPLVGGFGARVEFRSTHVFPISATGWDWAYQMARFAADLGGKTPGVVMVSAGEQEDADARDGFEKGFASKGQSIAAYENVDITHPDYTDVVLDLQANGVDTIVTGLDQLSYARLFQAMKRQQYDPLHVGTPFVMDPVLTGDPEFASLVDDVYFAADFEPLTSNAPREVKDFADVMRSVYSSAAHIDTVAEMGWTGAKMFIDVFRQMTAGGRKPTRAALMSILESWRGKPTGFTPPVTFKRGNHYPHHCLKFAHGKDGIWTTVSGWVCATPPPGG